METNDLLIKLIKSKTENNNSVRNVNHIIYELKSLKAFENVFWREIIKYSIRSRFYEHYKLGQRFKNSLNGIYDFIINGISFGCLRRQNTTDEDYYDIAETSFGILYLQVDMTIIHCYYKINLSCNPAFIELSIEETLDDIVNYGMSPFDMHCAYDNLKHNVYSHPLCLME
jgi:hypothetical protein